MLRLFPQFIRLFQRFGKDALQNAGLDQIGFLQYDDSAVAVTVPERAGRHPDTALVGNGTPDEIAFLHIGGAADMVYRESQRSAEDIAQVGFAGAGRSEPCHVQDAAALPDIIPEGAGCRIYTGPRISAGVTHGGVDPAEVLEKLPGRTEAFENGQGRNCVLPRREITVENPVFPCLAFLIQLLDLFSFQVLCGDGLCLAATVQNGHASVSPQAGKFCRQWNWSHGVLLPEGDFCFHGVDL